MLETDIQKINLPKTFFKCYLQVKKIAEALCSLGIVV